jgi:hypothetical protein
MKNHRPECGSIYIALHNVFILDQMCEQKGTDAHGFGSVKSPQGSRLRYGNEQIAALTQARRVKGGLMSACNFNRLVQFVNKRLDLDGQQEIYCHLDRCEICRDAVYELSRERNKTLRLHRAYGMTPSVPLRRVYATARFQTSAK